MSESRLRARRSLGGNSESETAGGMKTRGRENNHDQHDLRSKRSSVESPERAPIEVQASANSSSTTVNSNSGMSSSQAPPQRVSTRLRKVSTKYSTFYEIDLDFDERRKSSSSSSKRSVDNSTVKDASPESCLSSVKRKRGRPRMNSTNDQSTSSTHEDTDTNNPHHMDESGTSPSYELESEMSRRKAATSTDSRETTKPSTDNEGHEKENREEKKKAETIITGTTEQQQNRPSIKMKFKRSLEENNQFTSQLQNVENTIIIKEIEIGVEKRSPQNGIVKITLNSESAKAPNVTASEKEQESSNLNANMTKVDQDVIICDQELETPKSSKATQSLTRPQIGVNLGANEIRKRKNFIEQVKRTYDQLFKEMKFNADIKVREIMAEANMRVMRARAEVKAEYEAKIKEVKSKQWCIQCGEKAMYFCCWNNSYCSEECQRIHWVTQHSKTCTRDLNNAEQTQNDSGSVDDSNETNYQQYHQPQQHHYPQVHHQTQKHRSMEMKSRHQQSTVSPIAILPSGALQNPIGLQQQQKPKQRVNINIRPAPYNMNSSAAANNFSAKPSSTNFTHQQQSQIVQITRPFQSSSNETTKTSLSMLNGNNHYLTYIN